MPRYLIINGLAMIGGLFTGISFIMVKSLILDNSDDAPRHFWDMARGVWVLVIGFLGLLLVSQILGPLFEYAVYWAHRLIDKP
jgi:hypothetical protein